MNNKGLLITFEGLDGAGKTTQITLLEMYFKQRGIDYVATKEPGGTSLGKETRRLLFNPPENIDPLAETMLFIADRAQHFANIVIPALNDGKVVICDRCIDSNIVYQGIKGIDINDIKSMSREAMRGIEPDITILLDMPPDMVKQRKDNTSEVTRFDNEDASFHVKVRSWFLGLAALDPERIKVIDAAMDVQSVHREIARIVGKAMKHIEKR